MMTMMMMMMMMMMILGFRLRLPVHMIMRPGVPVLFLLSLLRLTLLWLLSFRLLRSSRLLWCPSRLDWQLSKLVRQRSSSRCPRGCFHYFRLFKTGRTLFSSSF
jgi:hypothetical protein